MPRRLAMLKNAFSILLISALLVISGCGGKPRLRNPAIPDASLVYGYLNIASGDSELGWLDIKKVWPPDDKPYFQAGVLSDGRVFWNEHLPPGAYQISGFGHGAGTSVYIGPMPTKRGGSKVEYSMEKRSSNITSMEIKEPGLYFIGSYKVKMDWSRPAIFSREFELVRLDRPDEAYVLEQILPLSKGTRWEKAINERLRELGR